MLVKAKVCWTKSFFVRIKNTWCDLNTKLKFEGVHCMLESQTYGTLIKIFNFAFKASEIISG